MYKLDLEKAKEHFLYKKQENSRKTPNSASLTTLKPLTLRIKKPWQILKEMGIPDHLTCLLQNLYAGQEAPVRTRHGTMHLFKTGKGVCQGCVFSSGIQLLCNAGLDVAQAGIKIAGRNINNLRYTDDMNRKCKSRK